ncbi:sulfotransferase 1C4-like [Haliotis rufescens]|uniref:sulfotransferase 1C4-like n=1 Tax=Haliotis rufescens TaxID=6454 RepID=UPI00201EE1E1|nr:sulfotransferase 1C4-like [Haliotis rufescens]
MTAEISHKLPGEHVYDGILFFGYTPPDILDAVKDFEVRDDDVFIITYPKAGTTWMQEVLWLVMSDGNFDSAYQKPVYFRSPFLEFKDDVLNEVGLELAEPMPSPRVIKSHLQVKLMPRQIQQKNCKIVVLFRNPKDLCVSYYHFYKSSSSFGNYQGTWAEFLYMFLSGHVDHGSWFDFTRGWWQERHNANVHIVFYEDMKKDLAGAIKELAVFLGKGNLGDELIDRIARHCTFDSMKQNPMTNHEDVYSIDSKMSPLLRKGKVGDWKDHFTVYQHEVFDQEFTSQLGDLNIPFVYQL